MKTITKDVRPTIPSQYPGRRTYGGTALAVATKWLTGRKQKAKTAADKLSNRLSIKAAKKKLGRRLTERELALA